MKSSGPKLPSRLVALLLLALGFFVTGCVYLRLLDVHTIAPRDRFFEVAYGDPPRFLRTTTRGAADPGARRAFIGFRVALTR